MPRNLKIFANYPTIIDFTDAENTKPHLDISLLEGETGAVEYPLRIAAFTSVHTLSLYFVSHVLVEYCSMPFAWIRRSARASFPLRLLYMVACSSRTDCGQGNSVGGDVCRVYYVGFKGDSKTGKKDGTNKLEIPAANAPDASLVDRLKEKSGGQQTTAR